jgi:hypothetical protein
MIGSGKVSESGSPKTVAASSNARLQLGRAIKFKLNKKDYLRSMLSRRQLQGFSQSAAANIVNV